MRQTPARILTSALLMLLAATFSSAQSRNNAKSSLDPDGAVLSITAWRDKESTDPIRIENIRLYENGIEQKIKNFSYDPAPARIVIIVDNSLTLRADIESLKKAVMEFAYEIFEGDQLFVIAYDEKPEIIQEWTDDAKKMEESLKTFRKKGNPYLFDALSVSNKEILAPLMPGTRKTAIVVIGDGLDRGSESTFQKTLTELQNQNVTVYALQLPDRTNGAFRRNQPKAAAVVQQLTEGTGGLVFPFEEAQKAAKTICDELRNSRYLLSYFPTDSSSYEQRRLLVIGDTGINIRTKNVNPPNIR